MVYTIDFDCSWDQYYPISHTSGTYQINVDHDLAAIYDIRDRFLIQRSLRKYHFIVSSRNGVFELKKGA